MGSVPSPAELVANGTPLADATAEVERLAAENDKRAETYKVARSALDVARRNLSRLVAEASGRPDPRRPASARGAD